MRLSQADYGLLPRGAMRRYDTAERRLYLQRYQTWTWYRAL